MKRTLLVVLMLLLALTVSAQFRGTEWGMTEEEVIELEGDLYQPGYGAYGRELQYSDKILGYDVAVSFAFSEERLVAGTYSFDSKGADSFRRKLEEKYGEGYTDNFISYFWFLEGINTVIMLADDFIKAGILIVYVDFEFVSNQTAQQNEEAESKF